MTEPASLVKFSGIPVFAIKGENNKTYYSHIKYHALSVRPHMTMDDGADLVSTIHKAKKDLLGRPDRRYGRDDNRSYPPEGHGREGRFRRI